MHSMYFKIYQDLACRYGGEVVIKVELDEDTEGPGAIPGLQFSLLCSSQKFLHTVYERDNCWRSSLGSFQNHWTQWLETVSKYKNLGVKVI